MENELLEKDNLPLYTQILTDSFNSRYGFYNYWVVEDHNTEIVVGWQSYSPVFTTPLKRDTVVESSTYILKEYQNKGIGTKLISFSQQALKESKLLNISTINHKNVTDLYPQHFNKVHQLTNM